MAELDRDSALNDQQLTQNESPPPDELDNLDGEALFNTAFNLVKNNSVQDIKKALEQVKAAFDKRITKDRAEAGRAVDFDYTHRLVTRFNRLLHEQKARELQENRKRREALIEALKQLYQEPENIGTTFEKFRSIQRRWKDAGAIPRRYSNDIFKTYHHHLENFYDYLHLNRARREKDFQNNLKEKERVIARAEALVAEPNIHKAYNELQYLHKIWKEEIGPVDKKYREPLWKAFKAATNQIHNRRQEYFHKRDAKQGENLVKKKAIIAQLIEIGRSESDNHRDWQRHTQRFNTLHKAFTTIGKTPAASRNEVWKSFRAACRSFSRKKDAFYKGLKKEQTDNLEAKMALIQTAAANREREDWDEAVALYKEIQQNWKNIGCVPQHKSNAIWEAFRSHCDYFFDRYHGRDKDKGLGKTVAEKEKLIEKARDLALPDDVQEALGVLQGLAQQWIAAGKLPEEKEALNKRFYDLLGGHCDTLRLEKTAPVLKKYQMVMAGSVRDQDRLFHETQFVRHRISRLKKELYQLENNIAFFSGDTAENPILQKAQQNIEALQRKLAIWRGKLDSLRAVSPSENDG